VEVSVEVDLAEEEFQAAEVVLELVVASLAEEASYEGVGLSMAGDCEMGLSVGAGLSPTQLFERQSSVSLSKQRQLRKTTTSRKRLKASRPPSPWQTKPSRKPQPPWMSAHKKPVRPTAAATARNSNPITDLSRTMVDQVTLDMVVMADMGEAMVVDMEDAVERKSASMTTWAFVPFFPCTSPCSES
jgi:hypothetical protein